MLRHLRPYSNKGTKTLIDYNMGGKDRPGKYKGPTQGIANFRSKMHSKGGAAAIPAINSHITNLLDILCRAKERNLMAILLPDTS